MVLRRLNADDLPELKALGRSTYYEAFAQDNTAEDMRLYLDESFSDAKLTRELANPNSIFYFAQVDGVTAGYCKLNFGPAQTEPIEDAIELERIYVVAGFQGRGVGAAMMQRTIALARAKKVSYLWLGVWEKNPRAITFYRDFGFERFGQHIYHLGTDPQLDLMLRLKIKQ
ncbi:GNAT family N-acetyltransferase [Lewinellaceae bacterium SD302]|nr:GNAT family N-acetyltransferase [Lewinellaceae bacterium SD302]